MSHAHETLALVNAAIETLQEWPVGSAPFPSAAHHLYEAKRHIISEAKHVPDLTAAVIEGRDVLAMLEGGGA